MTVDFILAELKSLKNETMWKHNLKNGAGDRQFGVKMGDIRAIAKRLKSNHEFGLELWATNLIEPRLLAILLINPTELTKNELDTMVRSEPFIQVADWLNAYIVSKHPNKEALRIDWMQTSDPMAARAGWGLTAGCVARNPNVVNIVALLDRIENEMATAQPAVQWNMNTTLAYIGIHFAEFRQKALDIGEKLGLYRDFPTSKGCTSPFAPIWINEMVRRRG